MSDTEGQLDLLTPGTQVPQANNVHLLVALMEALGRGEAKLDELAEQLEVEPRTVRYYVDLARWLGLLRQTAKRTFSPTETGRAFSDSVSARGRLFSQALFGKEVVKLANQIKRQALDQGRELSTRDACLQAIERSTTLSESTAKRRASSLARLLEAAYRPSRVDWETGEVLDDRNHPALEFDGESFLTAFAMKKLGVGHRMQIGLPRQVRRFVAGQAHKLDRSKWRRASYPLQGSGQWFGSVPVNDITREIALRGGRDLRQLLIITVPFVTLACAFLELRDPLERAETHMTEDMYGVRLWYHETELGAPLEVFAALADALDLECCASPPHLDGVAEDDAAWATDADLVAILEESGIVRRKDTVVEIAPGVTDEWHHESADSPSVEERLEPLREELRGLLRRWDA